MKLSPQQGNSLISLMISIVISLMGFAASFQFFTSMLVFNNEHEQIEQMVSQSALAKINLELDIMEAGFGLLHGAYDHISLPSASNLNTRIRWRYKDLSSGQIICTGIEDKLVHGQRIISQLNFNAPCIKSSHLNNGQWSTGNEIARLDQTELWLKSLSIGEGVCWPFDPSNKKPRHSVSIEYQLDSGSAHHQNKKTSLCLIHSDTGA